MYLNHSLTKFRTTNYGQSKFKLCDSDFDSSIEKPKRVKTLITQFSL